MKRACFSCAAIAAILLLSCSKDIIPVADVKIPPPSIIEKPVVGYNQNWSFLPQLNPTILSNIKQLKPEMIRYPGGTIAHSWDWTQGIKIGSGAGAAIHPLADIKSLTDNTGCQMIFVLDIVNRTLEDQILMLNTIQKLGVSITHIELGNELYGQDDPYINAFPTGNVYGQKAALWANQLKQQFPKAKIAALLQARSSNASNQRLNQWNSLVIAETNLAVDAYTYHVYIPEGGYFKSRKEEFDQVVKNANTQNKPLWITEYGNQNSNTSPSYLKSLDSLASYIETYPKVTVALNHLIVGNEKNKLTADGSSFTPEGTMFLGRASKR